MAIRLWSSLLLQLPLALRIVAATCYFPNGDTADEHFSCTSPSGTSVCCSEGFQCLSNGLCADPRYDDFGRVLRGACTEEGWGSGCTSFCKSDWPDRDEVVYYCGSGKWCCESRECCEEGKGLMDLGEPSVVAVASEGAIASTQAPSTTSRQLEQETVTKAQESSATPEVPEVHVTATTGSGMPLSTLTNPSLTSIPSATLIVVVSGTTITLPPTSTASYVPDAIYKGSNNTIAFGVGIGVGVAALLLAAVFGGWYWLRRKKRKGMGQKGVMQRNVESRNPFERREYMVELEGDAVPEMAGGNGGRDPNEMGGNAKRVSRVELEAVVQGEAGLKERELKTWPL